MSPIVVWTQHNDTSRTGANLQEVVLNTSNVNPEHFGKLFTYPVQGDVYAQPLYVSKDAFPNGGTHNVMYVATMTNGVYAFDADDPKQATIPLWQRTPGHRPLEPSIRLPNPHIGPPNYQDILGQTARRDVGILSTPVISLAHNAIYVVTASTTDQNDPNAFSHHLHALDLTTGEDKFGGPTKIQGSVTGAEGKITFTSNRQLQRAALLLAHDTIYVAFAAYGDQGPYNGWIFAYNASTLSREAIYCTTPDSRRGEAGIWQAGQGPAADSNNFIYVMTGNGTRAIDAKDPTVLKDAGCTVVRLNPNLTISNWFTPHNSDTLSQEDQDLGSAGPMLIPDTNLLIGGGKESKFYVMQRDKMGHFNAANDNQIVQSFYVNQDTRQTHHIHGGPVYWNGPQGRCIYVWVENDTLRAYQFDNGRFQTTPTSRGCTVSPGMPGGILSVSANGNTAGTGIVWASHPLSNANQAVVPGMLHAYDASDLGRELWNSQMNPDHSDDIGNFAKFCPPTVANGKVYMASFSGYVAVYGLLLDRKLPYHKVVLQETAIGGPALANQNDTILALAWTGTDNLHSLNVAISSDGQCFGGKVTLQEFSPYGPALAFGNERLYLAWAGTDANHSLNVMSSPDKRVFSNKVTLQEFSPYGPALAFGNERLYLAWAGTDANHSLNVMSSTDGINFTNKVTLGDTSAAAPALSFSNGTLYLAWVGTDANHSLNVMSSTDGMHFTNKVTLSESSDVPPALVGQNGLLLAWTGRDAAHQLNLLSGGDIGDLRNKRTYMEDSVAGPTLVTFKGSVYLGWTGTDSVHSINIGGHLW